MMERDWMSLLGPQKRAKAQQLIQLMRELGAPDPEAWVKPEILHNFPALARFLVARRCWSEIIGRDCDDCSWIYGVMEDAEKDPTGYYAGSFPDVGPALKRLVESGVDLRDIGSVARFISYSTAFDVLNIIDEGYYPGLGDDGPGWALVETHPGGGELTGRQIYDLHAELAGLIPSVREGDLESSSSS